MGRDIMGREPEGFPENPYGLTNGSKLIAQQDMPFLHPDLVKGEPVYVFFENGFIVAKLKYGGMYEKTTGTWNIEALCREIEEGLWSSEDKENVEEQSLAEGLNWIEKLAAKSARKNKANES